ncbi:MAG: hypothetical protein PHY80_01520 [Rickettsiales bacterium]|nr:hypothetical protein [Rickettsiales bacterium]
MLLLFIKYLTIDLILNYIYNTTKLLTLDLNMLHIDHNHSNLMSLEQLISIVQNPNTNSEQLVEIWRTRNIRGNKINPFIMNKIAIHHNTPSEVFEEMFREQVCITTRISMQLPKDYSTYEEMFTYLNTTFSGLTIIETTDLVNIDILLVKNPNTSSVLLERIWNKYQILICYGALTDWSFNENFAMHPNISPKILRDLYRISNEGDDIKSIISFLAIGCFNIRKHFADGINDGERLVKYIYEIKDKDLKDIIYHKLTEINDELSHTSNQITFGEIALKIEEIRHSYLQHLQQQEFSGLVQTIPTLSIAHVNTVSQGQDVATLQQQRSERIAAHLFETKTEISYTHSR